MGYKTRSNYSGVCVKSCENRGNSCSKCIRFSNYKERGIKEGGIDEATGNNFKCEV